MRIQFHFCAIPAKEGKPEQNHDKPLGLSQTEGHFTKQLAFSPQKCQGHESQGKTEEVFHMKKTEVILQLNAMHDSELELFAIKNILGIIGNI